MRHAAMLWGNVKRELGKFLTKVFVGGSLTGTGTEADPIELKGDEENPGPLKYYGTDEHEVLTYHNFPEIGGDYKWNLKGKGVLPEISNIQIIQDASSGDYFETGEDTDFEIYISAFTEHGETIPQRVPYFKLYNDSEEVKITWDEIDGTTGYYVYIETEEYGNSLWATERFETLNNEFIFGLGSYPVENDIDIGKLFQKNTAFIDVAVEVENDNTIELKSDDADIIVSESEDKKTKTVNFDINFPEIKIPEPEDIKGPQGDVGPQGVQGNTGVQGNQGYQGFQGFQGTQGFQGVQGSQGTQGFQGNQGQQGSQGSQGKEGSSVTIIDSVQDFTNLPGYPSSYVGDKGDGYITNSDGHLWVWSGTAWVDVGEIRGPQGNQGAQGTAGAQGAQGAQGGKGEQGDRGYQGDDGTRGPQGERGQRGPAGAQGERGYQGYQGRQGSQGTPGGQGPQGSPGSQGTPGPQGSPGSQGPQGHQGKTGSDLWELWLSNLTPAVSVASVTMHKGNVLGFNVGYDWSLSKWVRRETGYGAYLEQNHTDGKVYLRMASSAGAGTTPTFPRVVEISNSTGAITASNFILNSLRKLKKQIQNIINLKRFDKIPLYQFIFKDDKEERIRYGVIAEEVEAVAPNLVYSDLNGNKQVAYIDLLIAKVARLEERVNELERKEYKSYL